MFTWADSTGSFHSRVSVILIDFMTPLTIVKIDKDVNSVFSYI